jgi:hypothetical protein
VVQGREADKYSARACGGAAPEGRVEDKSVVLLDEGDEVLGLELEVGLAGPADREARPRLVLEGSIEHVATGRSVSDQIDEEGVRREKRTPNVSILPWQLKFMTLPTALPTSRSNLGSSVSCRPARTRLEHTPTNEPRPGDGQRAQGRTLSARSSLAFMPISDSPISLKPVSHIWPV